MERLENRIHRSGLIIENIVDKNTYDNPGNEIRKECYGLGNLLEVFPPHFAENNGKPDGQHLGCADIQQVVEYGVSCHEEPCP